MKKGFVLVCLFVFLFSGCMSIKAEKLQSNGNYIDNNFFYTLTVERVNTLSELGVTPDEWKAVFNDGLLYKAHSDGNAYYQLGTLQQGVFDAVMVTAKKQKRKYVAYVAQSSSVDRSTSTYMTTQNYTATTSDGKSVKISVPKENYVSYNFYAYDTYVIMFNDLKYSAKIRDIFGKTQIFTVQ